MGAGICGAILLEFEVDSPRDKKEFLEKSVNGIMDNYNPMPAKNKNSWSERFIIKDEILLPNYADFLKEFYDLIYDESNSLFSACFEEKSEDYINNLLSCKTKEEFDKTFSPDARNSFIPCISRSLSCFYCEKNIPFIFYSGSYKAYLEEYTTLAHMERMLKKAMTNPLRTAVKFGIN